MILCGSYSTLNDARPYWNYLTRKGIKATILDDVTGQIIIYREVTYYEETTKGKATTPTR